VDGSEWVGVVLLAYFGWGSGGCDLSDVSVSGTWSWRVLVMGVGPGE